MRTTDPQHRARAATTAAALVLGLASVAAWSGTSSASPAFTACGKISVKQSGTTSVYAVRRYQGKTSCRRARTILHWFIAEFVPPTGWYCQRGHASQNQRWAAQCSNEAGALLRAY